MYLKLGPAMMIRDRDIIGIFDLDITSQSHRTRQFLRTAEERGEVESATDDLPKSFVLCQWMERQRIILTQPNSAVIAKRATKE